MGNKNKKNDVITRDEKQYIQEDKKKKDKDKKKKDKKKNKKDTSSFVINTNGVKKSICKDIIVKDNKTKDCSEYQTSKQEGKIRNDSLTLNQHIIRETKNCYELSEIIMKKERFIFTSGSLYCYKNNIYSRVSEHEGITLIRSLLPNTVQKKLKSNDFKEILNLIKTNPEVQKTSDEIKMDDKLICFKNGVYNLKNEKLYPHSSDNYFFSYVNVDYNPEEKKNGDNFKEYLKRCTNEDEDLKKLLLEVIGYIISDSMACKKVFIIQGVPDSGKSTFGEFLKALLGQKNCSHIALQDLCKKYQVAELCGKKLNINMELPDTSIKDTGIIKQLSGNDFITAENKYENLFSFKNQAKLLYGCNCLPTIQGSENARAFFNRVLIIPFVNSIPPEEQDRDLIKKLIAESNYIVRKALKAYKRLVENNYVFTEPKISRKAKEKYMNNSNSVVEFVHECCIIDKGKKIYGKELYDQYIRFCDDKDLEIEEIYTYKKFCATIQNHFDIVHSKWRDSDGENRNGFKGIALKEK